MKYLIAVSFCVSCPEYVMIEESSSELIVKFGNNFNKIVKEAELCVPVSYVFSFKVQVLVDNIVDEELTLKVSKKLDKIIYSKNLIIWDEMEEYFKKE